MTEPDRMLPEVRVTLSSWSVGGTTLPGGHVFIRGTFDGHYLLALRG